MTNTVGFKELTEKEKTEILEKVSGVIVMELSLVSDLESILERLKANLIPDKERPSAISTLTTVATRHRRVCDIYLQYDFIQDTNREWFEGLHKRFVTVLEALKSL